eukprot:246792_1
MQKKIHEKGTDIIPFEHIPELRGPIDEKNNIFIRPKSWGITAIWYKFTWPQGCWFWTPYSNYRHLKEWISVETTVVPTGFYSGHEPAAPNIRIIHYLQDNQPIPPGILYQLTPKSKLSLLKFTASNVRLITTQKLQYSFIIVDTYSILTIFKPTPQYDDNNMIRIDLICNTDKQIENKQQIVRFQRNTFGNSDQETSEFYLEILYELQMLKRNDICLVYGFIQQSIVSRYGLIIPHDIKQLILNIYKGMRLFPIRNKIDGTDKWGEWNVKTTQLNST